MQLKFKKLSEKAVIPAKAHATDAGYDLVAVGITTQINECGQLMLVYHSGIAVEIPEGYVGLLFPRSSVYKKSLALTNSVGVIDSGYRGEIMAVFKATTDVVPAVYKDGEKFAQLVILPCPDFEVIEAEELSESDRGENGYGSTGDAAVSTVSTEDTNEGEVENTDNVTPETEPAIETIEAEEVALAA